jgi:membrane protease YdiL (CAAX protease family)
MPSTLFARTSAKLLNSTPNYLEVTAIIGLALATRLLWAPILWQYGATAITPIAIVITIFLYGCLGHGNLFQYVGWVKPRRRVFWINAIVGGIAGAIGTISIMHLAGVSLGSAPTGALMFGLTVGPIVEEIIYRGAAFSAIYVTASSSKWLASARIALSIFVSSLLFALSHGLHLSLRILLIFGMGLGYGTLRWRSNSTAASALMHLSYNSVITLAMLFTSRL